MQEFPDSLLAVVALSLILGFRHGLDPDHLAAIDSMARSNSMHRPRLARLTGTLFSLGHGGVVVLVAILAAGAVQQYHPPVWMTTLGAAISIICLLGMSLGTLSALWRAQPDAQVVIGGLRAGALLRVFSAHSALAVLGIGALFALSFDTLSLGVLFGGTALKLGGPVRLLLPSLSFVVGMAATDGLNGLVVAKLAARADLRAATASRLMAAAVAGIGLLVALFTLVRTTSAAIDDWADMRWLTISLTVIAVPLAAFGVAMCISQTGVASKAVTHKVSSRGDTDGAT